MSAGLIGYFVGSFAMSLLFAAIWLIICKVMPPMKMKPGVAYGVAMALAFVPPLLTIGVSDVIVVNFVAAFACVGLLFWQYKRGQAKHTEVTKSAGN